MANRRTLYDLADDDIERFKAATQNLNAFTDHYLRTPMSGTLYAAGDDWAPVFDQWRQNGSDVGLPVAVHGADWRPITPNPKNQHAPVFELVSNPEITLSPDNKWFERFIAWREAGEPQGAKFFMGDDELSAVWGARLESLISAGITVSGCCPGRCRTSTAGATWWWATLARGTGPSATRRW